MTVKDWVELIGAIVLVIGAIGVLIRYFLSYSISKSKNRLAIREAENKEHHEDVEAAHRLSQVFSTVLKPLEDRIRSLEGDVDGNRKEINELYNKIWELQGMVHQKDLYIQEMHLKYDEQVRITTAQEKKIQDQDQKIKSQEEKIHVQDEKIQKQELRIRELEDEIKRLKSRS